MSIYTVVPQIDTNLQGKSIRLESGEEVTVRQWASTSYSPSGNSTTFSCPPPSLSMFVNRLVFFNQPFTMTVTGTTTGSAMLQAGYDSLRALPLAANIGNMKVTINNQTFTIESSDIVPYMHRYIKSEKRSTYPSTLDTYATYADGVAAVNNPLGQYFNSIPSEFMPRGSFPCTIVNGSTSSTLTSTVSEPIFLPPFSMCSEELGFSNVKTIDVTINWLSSLSRFLSHAASNATISSVSVALAQPSLTFIYMTPPSNYVPRPLTYSSQNIQRYITQASSSLTAGSSTQIVSTNMQLNSIPSHIYVFCREANANLTYASSDTFTSITGLSVQFNNVSGILSQADVPTLFKMCKENNLQDDYEQFIGYTANLGTKVGTSGTILKLMFGKDISLHSNNYVGQVGAFNLQINVNITNNSSATITSPTLYVISVIPEHVILSPDGNCERVLGYSQAQHDDAGQYVPYSTVQKYYGGSFKDVIAKIGKFLKPVVNFLKDTKAISTIAKMTPLAPFAPIVEKFGFGEGEGEGMPCGGRIMSKGELKRRIRRV